MSDEVRFEIGFRGGGRLAGELPAADWATLSAALRGGGSGGVEVTTGGDTWWVKVDEVVYVHHQAREKRLGFG